MSTYKVDITGINTSNLKGLTHEENMRLFRLMKEGDPNAKDELVNGNLKLVLSIVSSFNKSNVNMDDLFQVGVIGLIKAIKNFDISYNLKFSTYGVPLILGEIKKYLRDNTQLRVSRSIKDNAYQILKFKEEYTNTYGIEPSPSVISKTLNLTEYEIASALESLHDPMSIFDPIYSDSGDTIYLEEQIADTKEKNTDRDILISLHKALKMIQERERQILIERYVIGKTQAEIAQNLAISQAQVSRIEKNALDKVGKMIR